MAAMLRCDSFAKICGGCRNPAHRRKQPTRGPRFKRRLGASPGKSPYPPHANGDDARSITFIIRLLFGIIDVLRL
jgi:hypothetical protein